MRWKVGCGGEFSAPSGQITSPNYPQRYGDNLVCNYTITAAPDTYIVATFIDRFDIENHPLCVYDRLSAYQGNSTSSPIMARYCGSQLPAPIVSRSSLFLQFRTDIDQSSRIQIQLHHSRFHLIIEFLDKSSANLIKFDRMWRKDYVTDYYPVSFPSGHLLQQFELHLDRRSPC